MRMVIDIPEENYERLKFTSVALNNPYLKVIANGTPLPEGAEILTAEAYSDLCLRASHEIEQEPVLDKIRAEIMKLDDINPDYPMDMTVHISRYEVLQIIDKYRAESKGGADAEKWIDHSEDGYVECPICGHLTTCEGNIEDLHYCFWCGTRLEE